MAPAVPAGRTQCEKIFACNHADPTISSEALGRGRGGEGGVAAGGRCHLLIKPAVRNGGKKFEGQINFVVWAWRERKGIRRVEGLRCLGVATNVSLC